MIRKPTGGQCCCLDRFGNIYRVCHGKLKNMKQPSFVPGFRCSLTDGLIIVCGVIGAVVLAGAVWWKGFIVGYVVAHFFLFCNVVRMARPLELLWSAVFVILAGATIATGVPGWGATVAVSGVMTAAVVVFEIRKPSYHGAGWKRINPGLPDWWKSRTIQNDDRGATP